MKTIDETLKSKISQTNWMYIEHVLAQIREAMQKYADQEKKVEFKRVFEMHSGKLNRTLERKIKTRVEVEKELEKEQEAANTNDRIKELEKNEVELNAEIRLLRYLLSI